MSSSQRNYSSEVLSSMNGSSTWNNCISIEKEETNKSKWSSEPLYNLHATGDADLDGRKYIALPKGTDTSDPRIRREYNLM
jgi:hypothetical protein